MARLAASSSDEKTEVNPSTRSPALTGMIGTYFHSLDEKGRVIIPAKLRPLLTETFWMLLDENDNAFLCDFKTGNDILKHLEMLTREHADDEFIAAALERTTGAAELIQIENDSWRVNVPDILRFYAGLDKEVVTVGLLNRAVMWNRERWEVSHQNDRLNSAEVKKVQAAALRAGAAGFRREQEKIPVPLVEEEKVEEIAARRTGTTGQIAVGANSSTGDGKRGSRVLTLSNLGR